jgi:hypothetical protein
MASAFADFATTVTTAAAELPIGRAWLFFAGVFAGFTVLDQCFVRHVAPVKARYFILHVVFNAWVTVTVWGNAMAGLADPSAALEGGYTESQVGATAGIAGFHVYHALAFTGIAREEWIHHIVSCMIVPVIGIELPFARGCDVSNLGMCGIPGGVDYFLLALQKCNAPFAPSRLTQKRVSAFMNLLIRWPLMLLSSYMFLVGWSNGTLAASSAAGAYAVMPWLMMIGVVLHTLNAAYYADKVIGNYHVCAAEAVTHREK